MAIGILGGLRWLGVDVEGVKGGTTAREELSSSGGEAIVGETTTGDDMDRGLAESFRRQLEAFKVQ